MSLPEIAVLLAALALAGPMARWAGMAAVLGYLFAGVLIGPFGVGVVFTANDAKEVLHIAEFGVVLLLFLIGLELRPKRLYAMRQAIFGLGMAQVAITALALAGIGVGLGYAWQRSAVSGSGCNSVDCVGAVFCCVVRVGGGQH
jgi:glutathione-regulated potassium-efflux system protein KefB